MQKELLEQCLAEGMSLDAIGKRVGKHESTVSYWLKKHGLTAGGSEAHAPNAKVDPQRLEELVDQGASIQEMGDEFGAGRSTIRYWLRKLGLETERSIRLRETRAACREGVQRAYFRCRKHGHTAFYARPEGGFRCGRCSSEAVSKRRRSVKRKLVEGGWGTMRPVRIRWPSGGLAVPPLGSVQQVFPRGRGRAQSRNRPKPR